MKIGIILETKEFEKAWNATPPTSPSPQEEMKETAAQKFAKIRAEKLALAQKLSISDEVKVPPPQPVPVNNHEPLVHREPPRVAPQQVPQPVAAPVAVASPSNMLIFILLAINLVIFYRKFMMDDWPGETEL